MTESEKCAAGLLYDTGDPARERLHLRCAELCFKYNHTRPSNMKKRERLLRKIFGKLGHNPYIEPTVFFGFGKNVEAGDNFFANNNCVFVDPAKITFGNNVFLAPSCGFYTAAHPIDAELRGKMLEWAAPITVGNDVWIGGGTVVLPGVIIGDDVVIGAGSVVVHDIPSHSVAFGNPCHVQRAITPEDRKRDLSGSAKCKK